MKIQKFKKKQFNWNGLQFYHCYLKHATRNLRQNEPPSHPSRQSQAQAGHTTAASSDLFGHALRIRRTPEKMDLESYQGQLQRMRSCAKNNRFKNQETRDRLLRGGGESSGDHRVR